MKVVAVAAAATMAVGAYFVFASSASVLPSPVPAATSKAAEVINCYVFDFVYFIIIN